MVIKSNIQVIYKQLRSMKYMGSKNRFAKEMLPLLLKNRTKNQYYVEPFAGGMNMIDKVSGKRIANDIHTDLIEMWKALASGWIPPLNVSEEDYMNIKNGKIEVDKALSGYIGFNSYGGKWFSGYRRDKQGKRDYWREHYNNIMKQVPNIKDVVFLNSSFTDLKIPEGSIIYCDPLNTITNLIMAYFGIGFVLNLDKDILFI